MPFDGGPPLHEKAIESAKERADRLRGEINDHIAGGNDHITSVKLDAEVTGERFTENAVDSSKISSVGQIPRFPTWHLEPFQLQRAQALERAIAMLPDSMVEDQLKAAHFIETGHIPDA